MKKQYPNLFLVSWVLIALLSLTSSCTPQYDYTVEPPAIQSEWDREPAISTTLPLPTPAPQSTPNVSSTVYITATGEKYHRDGCQYLKKSKIPISRSDAIAKGYTPCSKCRP